MEKMELVAVVLIVFASAYSIEALTCARCEYFETDKDIGMTTDDMGSVACKSGGNSVPSVTCPAASSGNNPACVRAKVIATMEFELFEEKFDVQMDVYIRDCFEVSESDPAEGTVPENILRSALEQELTADMDEEGIADIRLNSLAAEYCSSNNCGKTSNIANLSGVSARLLPSLLTLVLFCLVSKFVI